MKSFIISILATSTAQRPSKISQVGSEKRYSDMKAIAEHIFEGGNDKFDEKQYWTYGCHCFFLGDRPLSDMGKGTPVDQFRLDRSCRIYKECQKCAREEHGKDCIGEFIKYDWSKNGPDDVKSSERSGTCARDLFECDREFAQNMFINRNDYKEIGRKTCIFHASEKYHQFYGKWDHSDKRNCPRGPGGPNRRECCGGKNRPFTLYNPKNLKCCNGIPQKNC